jgi:hypothetical protein
MTMPARLKAHLERMHLVLGSPIFLHAAPNTLLRSFTFLEKK